MKLNETRRNTKEMIDDLKAICSNYGLGNSSSEYKIITEVFLYKFINDKFIYEITKLVPSLQNASALEVEKYLNTLSDGEYDLLLMDFGGSIAKLKSNQLISFLLYNMNEENFYKLFDKTLTDIANSNLEIFSVKTGSQSKMKLFDSISQYIIEDEKKDSFCRAIIDKIGHFSFYDIFNQKYDFFADIFEYLIKDYNKDFGKYAEYYTPHSISSIIAKIMVPKNEGNVTVYDPAAGSGTLLLSIAHEIGEENCTIFSQDISQKSNEFLRLNLILNNLVHSLPNVIHEDTLVNPRHINEQKDDLFKFDYVVSNPPFNMDFSENRNLLASDSYKKRFFAGVPNIREKSKSSMAIYLLFIQHIIYSLNERGKASIVVPTGFLTKDKKIERSIKKYLVENKYLKGIISMPPNIFANTPTGVSILFIDKENNNDEILLFDATSYGHKSTETEKNKKIILSDEDANNIINTFNENKEVENVSVKVSYEQVISKNYSLSPGQYFKREIAKEKYSQNAYQIKLNERLNNLKLFLSYDIEEINSLIFHMWFIQFNFPDHHNKPYAENGGKMVYNDLLNMDIPEGWAVKDINEVCDVIDCLHSKKPNYNFESDEYYLLQLDNLMDNGRIDVKNKYYISKTDYKIWSKKIELKENDFVVTNAGRAGAIGMIPKGVTAALGRNFTAIRPHYINPYYLRQFFYSSYMNVQIQSNLDEGSFFKSLNVKSIKKLFIVVPPEDVMQKYLELMQPVIYDIVNGIEDNPELKKIKKLISDLA